jgi:hypothetical protein
MTWPGLCQAKGGKSFADIVLAFCSQGRFL